MPIKSMSMTVDHGSMVQLCAACGAEHTISLNRAAQKAKTGPVILDDCDTLVVRVDAEPPATVTFRASDFSDLTRITAAELAAKVNAALPGVRARDDARGLLIESATAGEASRIEIVGGTARAALGFATDGLSDPCVTRPVLGVSLGTDVARDPNVIALRRCNDCGANECLVRTFDAAPAALRGSHFHEHRKAVNALAHHCKTNGWSHPDVAEHHAAETAVPHDLDTGFPDRPCVLPRFSYANAQSTAVGSSGGAR